MAKIKKLPDFEARKIAAGEVVERPANVIKELVENSIDAQANQITIYIQQAGKKLIQIIDNGTGMCPEDAKLCFEHHATSKITAFDDLNSLNTFGFRGEALSSISSVSKINLLTKEAIAQQGFSVELHEGKIVQENYAASNIGTQITVSDIFFNVPARAKFLKKDETELRAIVQIFQAFCLAYPDIHFKLFHDNALVYNCPKVDSVKSRVAQLWDNNLVSNTLELTVKDETIDLNVNAIISNHQLTRYNKQQIFFFVNGRWIKNTHLLKAFVKGYSNVLPQDKFPAGFIFLKIEPNFIDVNVHPKKEEVLFLHPKKIDTVITNSVKNTLEKNLSKQITQTQPDQIVRKEKNFYGAMQTTFDFDQLDSFEPANSYTEPILPQNIVHNSFSPIHESIDFIKEEQVPIEPETKFDIIGQYNNCYILLQQTDGLFLVDQHAAHERILYEVFTNNFQDLAKIKLMFPIIINLSQANINLIENYLDILRKFSIEIERFSQDQLIIHCTPVHLKDVSLNDLIMQLIGWIEEDKHLSSDELFKAINNKLCAQMACKAAIKAGDTLNKQQMVQLLNDLQTAPNKLTCPHGRPTGWLLSLNEIEKKFKRKL